MLLPALAIAAGFAALFVGADRLVAGASGLARNLRVSSLLIGLTIVSIGTSMPEFFVSGVAALRGESNLAVGNAIGSNIANIGMVLGATALVRALTVQAKLLWREMTVMLGALLFTWWLLFDGALSTVDGALLLLGLLAFTVWTVRTGMREGEGDGDGGGGGATCTTPRALLFILIGLALLSIGSESLVWGAVMVARHFGTSELIIGLTVIAIGTSLPEAAACIAGALKGEGDIAMGNIIGSNIFNMFGVIGITGVLGASPAAVDSAALARDMPVMVAMTLAMFFFAILGLRTSRVGAATATRGIGAGAGGVLLGAYVCYLAFLVYTAV
ncbi:MAG: calcium/sodium antiporter [Gammaproteobacteria bacterium]|nr:calcium/sodium antiporter [Gammaproteobacteria bacterium]